MIIYPLTKIIFDRRKKSGPDKEGKIEIEIYFQARRKWISTGISVLPRHWHKDKRVFGRIDSAELNLQIKTIEERVNSVIRTLIAGNKPFSWSDYDSLFGNPKEKDSFIDFVENRVNTRKDISEGTRRNHRKFLNALKEFKILKDFSQLTKGMVYKYDEWLRCRKDYTQSTIASYHKFMKVYVNEALKLEKIKINPYLGIRIERGASRLRKYLTIREVERIEEVALPTKSLEKTRDVFIFQCYTALAYADLVKFDFTKVIERDGRFILHDTRQKTGEDFFIVLLPKAMEILRKYDFNLPVMSNQQYNMRLKIVGDTAGLDKKLTSHMGRHTYATMCLNSGVSIEVLARMMGHSDIKTTQIYAKMVNNTVEQAFGELEKKIEAKKAKSDSQNQGGGWISVDVSQYNIE